MSILSISTHPPLLACTMPALGGDDARMEANPFIIDHDSDDDRPHNSDKPRPSSDSDSDVDESALDREFLEKDSRFLDEPAMEEGHVLDDRSDSEYQGHAYPSPSKRSRTRQPKMFIFGLCCILLGSAAIGILAGSAFQSSSTTYIRKGGAKHLTMDHIFNGTFSPHLENIAWVKEGECECRAQEPLADPLGSGRWNLLYTQRRR